jgi:NAD(P)H-dependent FMN reductase
MSNATDPSRKNNELSKALNAALNIAPNRIGVIVCSQRSPRAGLQIGTFVLITLKEFQKAHPSPRPYELSLIDLNDHPLPLYDEPAVPSQIKHSSQYKHAHTREWSEFISSYQAFIFVTPQYNWGYPASIKNAIDYLYHEWAAKPAMVVSYGGHGGGKAAAQLQQVLEGINMIVLTDFVGLQFPDRATLGKAANGDDLGLRVVLGEEDGRGAIVKENAQATLGEKGATGGVTGSQQGPLWAKESKELCTRFWELVTKLNS